MYGWSQVPNTCIFPRAEGPGGPLGPAPSLTAAPILLPQAPNPVVLSTSIITFMFIPFLLTTNTLKIWDLKIKYYTTPPFIMLMTQPYLPWFDLLQLNSFPDT